MSIIEVKGLVKRYVGDAGIHGVSFNVEQGEIFGILGPNGAGKSTTVECIAGLRTPDSGSIRVGGVDPQREQSALRQIVGAQLQASELPDKIQVGEALALYSSFYRAPADWGQLAETLGLTAKLDMRFGQLSGGQKQRLSIALSLVGNPRVAILDELTTGLDPRARRETWELIERIRDRGVTVLLVTHFMEEAERLCDRAVIIDAGRVIAVDTPAGLISRVAGRQRLRFRTSAPLDKTLLAALPEVLAVEREGDELVVSGTGDLLLKVASLLASHRIAPTDLRVEQATLDDAFLALTGRPIES